MECAYFLFLRFYLFIFRKRGRERVREGENISMWLPLLCPLLGTWPATQACVLTGNQTGDLVVHTPVLIPLSYTSQVIFSFRDLVSSHAGNGKTFPQLKDMRNHRAYFNQVGVVRA